MPGHASHATYPAAQPPDAVEIPRNPSWTDEGRQGHASPLEAALSYASRKWRVLPLWEIGPGGECACGGQSNCKPGKHPRLRNGSKGASYAPAQIRKWWGTWPQANVGIVTGKRSGFFVLDLDVRVDRETGEVTKDGTEKLARLEAQHGKLPPTPKATTGGGGVHLFFRYPKGREVKKSTSCVAPGVDIISDGGYIVAPPSNHASGKQYAWEVHPDTCEMPDAPDWLLDLCEKRPETPLESKSKPKPSSLPSEAVKAAPAAIPRADHSRDGKGVQVPIINGLNNSQKRDLFLWIILRLCDSELNDNSGQVKKEQFLEWGLSLFSDVHRRWNSIVESQLVHNNSGQAVFLKSLERVTETLIKGVKGFYSDGRSEVFTAEWKVTDSPSLPAFKKWLTQQIAAMPVGRRRAKDDVDWANGEAKGRSLNLIAKRANVTRQTAIAHLKGTPRVRQYEEAPWPKNPEHQANISIKAIRSGRHYWVDHKRQVAVIPRQNSYRPTTIFKWRILLEISENGQVLRLKMRRARFGRARTVETRKARNVRLPISPLTRSIISPQI